MPHIHTEPGQHDLTASAFIVHVQHDSSTNSGFTEEPKILMHMHKKMGKLLQPGGHVELDESPWQAIKHEVLEESGYDFDQLHVLQPFPTVVLSNPDYTAHPYPIMVNTHKAAEGHYHTDLSFLFITSEMPNHNPGEGESTDLRWLIASELAALNNDEVASGSREIGLRALEVVLNDEWWPEPTSSFQ